MGSLEEYTKKSKGPLDGKPKSTETITEEARDALQRWDKYIDEFSPGPIIQRIVDDLTEAVRLAMDTPESETIWWCNRHNASGNSMACYKAASRSPGDVSLIGPATLDCRMINADLTRKDK